MVLVSFYEMLIFLVYNGFIGLGNYVEFICGWDWNFIGGDFGDLDLVWAIVFVWEQGKQVLLVIFGYMYYCFRYCQDCLWERVYVDY